MSKCVSIDNITEGMELELAVTNQYGQMLLPVNTKICEKHKKLFKTWGISSIYVKEEFSDSEDSIIFENEGSDELKALQDRFKWSPRNSYEEDLFKMVLMKISLSDKVQGGK